MLQGDPGSDGAPGIPGIPGEDGAVGSKVWSGFIFGDNSNLTASRKKRKKDVGLNEQMGWCFTRGYTPNW